MKQDYIVGAAITAFGVVYIILTANLVIPGSLQGSLVNAKFMPYILGVVMTVLGIAQIVVGAITPKSEQAAKKKTDYRSLLLSAVLMVLYVLLIEPVGFIVTSVVYLFVEFWLLTPPDKPRRPLLYLSIAVIGPVLTYLIFRYGFDMLLPVGILRFL